MKNKAVLTKNPVFDWEKQARQYPEQGNGIVYFKGYCGNSIWIDCLLFYGEDNLLQGILNHYPFEIFPFQKKGSVNIQVRSDKRKNGIATALLDEALQRFKINLKKQEYTPTGEKFIMKFIRTSTEYRLSRQKHRMSNSPQKEY